MLGVGERGGGGKGAGLLRTWLGDYGFPSVGRRPQQLLTGCLQPPRATSSQAWLPAHTSPFRSQTTRLPAPGGLSRGSTGGNGIHLWEPEACEEGSSCISPGGVVNKTPGPHSHSGRGASQPHTVSLGPLLHPLSSPCEQLWACLSPPFKLTLCSCLFLFPSLFSLCIPLLLFHLLPSSLSPLLLLSPAL